MTKGILYGVGVGPGDPELITMKAVRILKQADVIAVPDTGESKQTAFAIAAEWIADKEKIFCAMPMIRDKEKLRRNYDAVAEEIEKILNAGKNVAFITLGDPSVYSTYMYIHKRVKAHGYAAEMVPGVPSFCAAAAALGTSLCEGSEALHIVPASHESTADGLFLPGNTVFMKAGKGIADLCATLEEAEEKRQVLMVERCGMEGERVYRSLAEIGETASYFSVMLVKEEAE